MKSGVAIYKNGEGTPYWCPLSVYVPFDSQFRIMSRNWSKR